ncbi:MAG: FIST C-terminal domain-containing protein [Thiohalocapsa sp.]|nr:FIST C-terminal domain-containing protein [Thiohalocapsa sp.]MCF7993150.1 FIST C-terminal domain-containing protein [Thiohalocapsa sp.]
MQSFPYAHSASGDWHKLADDLIDGLRPASGTLGFLYVTDAVNAYLGDILDALREATGVEHWVGAVGIGICATGVEYYEKPAAAAMLADLPEDAFRVFPTIVKDLEGYDAAQRGWLGDGQPFLGLVHGDPANPLLESLIKQLAARTTTGFLVGGLASSNDNARVVADGVTEGGLCGVMFAESVGIQTNLTQGCSPIGPHRRITDCQRNVLAGLDGRPALDVFKEDIGEMLARDLSRVGGYIFAGLPIAGSDTGDYLVRNLIGVDTEQKLLAIGDIVEQGSELMFCRRDAETAREDLSRMLAHLKRRLSGPPRGGVYVSCVGRGANLFGEDSEELKQIRDELGDFPLVGFYANGEISRDRLYGYTGVLTLFT